MARLLVYVIEIVHNINFRATSPTIVFRGLVVQAILCKYI